MRTLKVNEIKVASNTAFIANLFALEGRKKLKYDEKLWGSLLSYDQSLSTLRLKHAFILFCVFFHYFLLLVEIKIKLIKLVRHICFHFLKTFSNTVHVLRVNETKYSSETVFIVDFFALEGEKE